MKAIVLALESCLICYNTYARLTFDTFQTLANSSIADLSLSFSLSLSLFLSLSLLLPKTATTLCAVLLLQVPSLVSFVGKAVHQRRALAPTGQPLDKLENDPLGVVCLCVPLGFALDYPLPIPLESNPSCAPCRSQFHL